MRPTHRPEILKRYVTKTCTTDVVRVGLAAAADSRADRHTQPPNSVLLQQRIQCLKICNTKMGKNQDQSTLYPSLPATVKWNTSL